MPQVVEPTWITGRLTPRRPLTIDSLAEQVPEPVKNATRESTLITERARPRDGAGVPLAGRELGRPEHFRLVRNGARCVLVHESSGQRFTLVATTCSPI